MQWMLLNRDKLAVGKQTSVANFWSALQNNHELFGDEQWLTQFGTLVGNVWNYLVRTEATQKRVNEMSS